MTNYCSQDEQNPTVFTQKHSHADLIERYQTNSQGSVWSRFLLYDVIKTYMTTASLTKQFIFACASVCLISKSVSQLTDKAKEKVTSQLPYLCGRTFQKIPG